MPLMTTEWQKQQMLRDTWPHDFALNDAVKTPEKTSMRSIFLAKVCLHLTVSQYQIHTLVSKILCQIVREQRAC